MLFLIISIPAHAAWVATWVEQGGGTIYYENSMMQFSGPVTPGTNPFIRAIIYTDYSSAVNSVRICYPAANDCQWKLLNVMVTYDWSCNNVVRLVKLDEEWDEGPTSESWKRDSYTAPEPRPHVSKPVPQAIGGQFNISNEPGLLAMQTAICNYWPR